MIEIPSLLGVSKNLEKTGSNAASVFPLPVGATNRTFSPSMIGGIAFTCGSVGADNPISDNAMRTFSVRRENTLVPKKLYLQIPQLHSNEYVFSF